MTTCGTCKFFKESWHHVFNGACHNMKATLGAVIQTSSTSYCNYYESRRDGESTAEKAK